MTLGIECLFDPYKRQVAVPTYGNYFLLEHVLQKRRLELLHCDLVTTFSPSCNKMMAYNYTAAPWSLHIWQMSMEIYPCKNVTIAAYAKRNSQTERKIQRQFTQLHIHIADLYWIQYRLGKKNNTIASAYA